MTEHYGYAGKILIVNLTDRTSQTCLLYTSDAADE